MHWLELALDLVMQISSCLCVLHYMYYRCMHVKTEENVHDLEWRKEIQKQKNCIKLDDVGLSHNRGRENIYMCVSVCQSPAEAEGTKRSGNQAIPKWWCTEKREKFEWPKKRCFSFFKLTRGIFLFSMFNFLLFSLAEETKQL